MNIQLEDKAPKKSPSMALLMNTFTKQSLTDLFVTFEINKKLISKQTLELNALDSQQEYTVATGHPINYFFFL